MSDICELDIEVDVSARSHNQLSSVNCITIDKSTIFMYGIFVQEVLERVSESNFEYLQSKVPYLIGLYDEYFDIEEKKIINKCKDSENKIRVTEMVGVGTGLYFVTQTLKLDKKTIRKIPRPISKIKYLDYQAIGNGKKYEIETKGTTFSNNVRECIKDCLSKKAVNSQNVAMRCGTITLLRNINDNDYSKLVICDDEEIDKIIDDNDRIKSILYHYSLFFSFILDSKYYNKFMRYLSSKKALTRGININKSGFRGFYEHNGRKYLGAYFDKRLIIQKLLDFYNKDLSEIYEKVTIESGKNKYFLGIDENIIDFINSSKWADLINYRSEELKRLDNSLILDIDGIIFVKSQNGSDSQLEKNYPEEKVRETMDLIFNYLGGKTHQCGASCRSWEKEGKPCEIRVYSRFCHFHR